MLALLAVFRYICTLHPVPMPQYCASQAVPRYLLETEAAHVNNQCGTLVHKSNQQQRKTAKQVQKHCGCQSISKECSQAAFCTSHFRHCSKQTSGGPGVKISEQTVQAWLVLTNSGKEQCVHKNLQSQSAQKQHFAYVMSDII